MKAIKALAATTALTAVLFASTGFTAQPTASVEDSSVVITQASGGRLG